MSKDIMDIMKKIDVNYYKKKTLKGTLEHLEDLYEKTDVYESILDFIFNELKYTDHIDLMNHLRTDFEDAF